MWCLQLDKGHVYTTSELKYSDKWSTFSAQGESDGSSWVLPPTHFHLRLTSTPQGMKGISLDLEAWIVSSTGLNMGGSQGVSLQFWPLLQH